MKNKIYILGLSVVFFMASACSDFLEEQVYTEYEPDKLLSTQEGIEALLVSAYGSTGHGGVTRELFWTLTAWPCDLEVEFGGGYRGIVVPFEEFTVDAGNSQLKKIWINTYVAIRNINSLLDYIDNVTTMSEEKVATLKAEAAFLRAWNYSVLYDLWGPVPLITTTDVSFEYPKATDDEMLTFIEDEYRAAIAVLPIYQPAIGKANKGSALALLGRFLMNTRQWEKAAVVLNEVMGLGKYALLDDVTTIFTVENEGNEEVIFVFEETILASVNNIMAHNYPPGYQTNLVNWGAQTQLKRSWVETYHPQDQRALPWDPRGEFGPVSFGWICYEYINKSGVYINLMDPSGGAKFHPRSFKYTPNETYARGGYYGNDLVIMRYADVLLLRSEVLAMIAGAPTQEAVDLLNQIRARAKVPTYTLANFSNLDAFIDAILDERGWEFVVEGYRRWDLKRQGRFISGAQARGKVNASSHHVVYPIPLTEMDANPLMIQNEGY